MSTVKITIKETCCEAPMIKELDYRTFVTNVPSGKDNVYVKVKKKGKKCSLGCGRKGSLSVEWEPGDCVLYNLKYGTLRQIPGDTRVTPLAADLIFCPLPKNRWDEVKKESYLS